MMAVNKICVAKFGYQHFGSQNDLQKIPTIKLPEPQKFMEDPLSKMGKLTKYESENLELESNKNLTLIWNKATQDQASQTPETSSMPQDYLSKFSNSEK